MTCPFCKYEGPHIHVDGGVVSPETWRLREELLQDVKGERDRMIARTIELGTELTEARAILREVESTCGGGSTDFWSRLYAFLGQE